MWYYPLSVGLPCAGPWWSGASAWTLIIYSCPGPLGCLRMGDSGQRYLISITYTPSTWWYSIDHFNNSSTLDRCMDAHVLLLLQITLYPHIAIFRINSGLWIINSIINQICRNYLLLYIPWTVHGRSCSTLLHGISAPYPSPTFSIIIEIIFAIIWATGTRLAFAMFVQVRPPYTQAR